MVENIDLPASRTWSKISTQLLAVLLIERVSQLANKVTLGYFVGAVHTREDEGVSNLRSTEIGPCRPYARGRGAALTQFQNGTECAVHAGGGEGLTNFVIA